MDELESRLDHELAGLGRVPLAEPEPVDRLRRRARRVRVGRAVTSIVGAGVAVAVIAAGVVATRGGSSSPAPRKVRVAAPSFVLGDIDAVVLSSTFDPDGARESFSPAVAATVARVPGVQSVSGVVDTFAALSKDGLGYNTGSMRLAQAAPPRTPILFSFHEPDEVDLLGGRLPTAPDEVVVDPDLLSRYQLALGDTVSFQTGGLAGQGLPLHIVGTFDLPGVDLTGIPLAAIPAAHQSPQLAFDRLDVKLAPGAEQANVRDAIATAVGNGFTVAQPSVISFPDQRVAQLEIQHAYWALLSPDPTERSTAVAAPANPNGNAAYQEHAAEAANAELRVENVTFVSPDAATLTYRVFYGGQPSPIVNAPQSGAATRVDGVWKLTKDTVCNLAAADHLACSGFQAGAPAPPGGYEPEGTLAPAVDHAFKTLADPGATVDDRIGAVWAGTTLRAEIAAGVAADRSHAGKSTLSILGWRTDGPDKIDVMYTLVSTNGPSTPWPSVATADQAADGRWYADAQYACGITGLTLGSCASMATAAPGVVGSP